MGDVEELVVEGSNITVCVTADTFKKIGVPEWLRHSLNAYMERFDTQEVA